MTKNNTGMKKLLRSKVTWAVVALIVFVGFFAYLGDSSSKYSYKGGRLHIASAKSSRMNAKRLQRQ